MDLRWNRDIPIESGKYAIRVRQGQAYLFDVTERDGRFHFELGLLEGFMLCDASVEWAGPLPQV